MQVAKWGNSLAVRLPTTLVKELGLLSVFKWFETNGLVS
jgi:hypothetical protein